VYEALNHPFFRTAPLPCKPEEMPKMEKECHELSVRQAIEKRKKQRLEKQRAQQKNKHSNNGGFRYNNTMFKPSAAENYVKN
jgi:hypothetical protein